MLSTREENRGRRGKEGGQEGTTKREEGGQKYKEWPYLFQILDDPDNLLG